MDGFDQGPTGDWAYTQLHRDQLPNYWHWAEHNTLFDNFFASAWGPSFPNHLYSIAAQSGGAHDNPRRAGFFSNTFGCDAPPQQKVEVVDSEGNVVTVPPCFDFETEGDLLAKPASRGRTTRRPRSRSGYIWSAYSAIRGTGTTRRGGRGTCVPSTRWCGDIQTRRAATGHVDHATVRALRAPRVHLLPRRELDHAGDRRDHAFADVEGHGDLHDLGRLRRVLRSRAAAAGRPDSGSGSACRCSCSARTPSTGR